MIKLGDAVWYHAKNIKNGPRMALVTEIVAPGVLNLRVVETVRDYPAFGVTAQPSTPAEHYWSLRE